MKRFQCRTTMFLWIAAIACSAGYRAKAAPEPAPDPPTGSISGTVTSPEKKPINSLNTLMASGVFIDIQEWQRQSIFNPGAFRVLNFGEQAGGRAGTDLNLGGFYTFKNLRPGVYNLLVEGGVLPVANEGFRYYRPQRIVGVVVQAGQDTTLNITMREGARLAQPGDPEGVTLEFVGHPRGNVGNTGRTAWIEGTITNPEGQPVLSARALIASGVIMTLKKSTGEQGNVTSDLLAGGFYSFAGLIPGTYDLIVEKGSRPGGVNYRPLIIHNVTIAHGVRTLLNIVLHPGDELEQITSPPIVSEPVPIPGKQP